MCLENPDSNHFYWFPLNYLSVTSSKINFNNLSNIFIKSYRLCLFTTLLNNGLHKSVYSLSPDSTLLTISMIHLPKSFRILFYNFSNFCTASKRLKFPFNWILFYVLVEILTNIFMLTLTPPVY